MDRLAGRPRPASSNDRNGDAGIGVSNATGRPRSVIVTVSPAVACATTADAFCFKDRIPTSLMFYTVALCLLEESTMFRSPRASHSLVASSRPRLPHHTAHDFTASSERASWIWARA